MIQGLAYFSWDTKSGSTLEAKHPLELEISDELVNKIYMTHSYDEDFTKEELIKILYKGLIVLSYCDKSKVFAKGYEIIILILDEKEKVDLYKLESQFIDFAKQVLLKDNAHRKTYLLENCAIFFETTSTKKILLIGRAGTGKTSIKKIIFEGHNPKDLLDNPLEPTRGISPSVYTWLDLNLGLFDSSGQELDYLLENENDDNHILAFANTNTIIYLFDYSNWLSNSQEIISDIQSLLDIIKRKFYKTNLILILHKIDLIEKENRKKILMDITISLKKQFKISIYYTSIYPELIYNLYNAFYELLSSSSKENVSIKDILDNSLIDNSKTMCFITNQNDAIVAQAMSKDFNTLIINHSHKLVTQLNKTFEDMTNNDTIEDLILTGSSNFNIIMNNLNYQKFGIKNLIGLSETLSANKLIWLVEQIRLKLKNLYY